MKNNERRLYQNNTTGYLLILLFIVLNIVFTIFTLNAMDKDLSVGIFVMMTIVLLLLGFLMVIKVRIYSMAWSVLAVCVGIFQFSRLFFTPGNLEGAMALFMNIILIVSALFCISGGLVSVINTKKRSSLL